MLAKLQNKELQKVPSLSYGSKMTNAHIKIAQILGRAIDPPPPVTKEIPTEPLVPANNPITTPTREPSRPLTTPQRVIAAPQRGF